MANGKVPKSAQAQEPGGADSNGVAVGPGAALPAPETPASGAVFRAVGRGTMSTGAAAMDGAFAKRWPALHEWLTLNRDRGQPLETATLLIFTEDGQWKACVHDRETSRVCFRASGDFHGLLDAVERSLADGTADWREKGGKRR